MGNHEWWWSGCDGCERSYDTTEEGKDEWPLYLCEKCLEQVDFDKALSIRQEMVTLPFTSRKEIAMRLHLEAGK